MSQLPGLEFLTELHDPTTTDAAWAKFVARYSALLLKVARHHAADREDVLDYYLHVCQSLVADDYRRLLAFRSGGPGEFAGWLAAVARNLCIDYLRSQAGRRRLPAAIARLDEVARNVFTSVYWEGLSPGEALERLRPLHAGMDVRRVALALDRIGACLRPYQLAEIAGGMRPRGGSSDPDLLESLPDEAPDPEAAFLTREELAGLRAEVALLPAADQALLRLRFEQGLTHAQAAKALGLGDYRKAHERLARILAVLRERLQRPRRG